MRKLSGAAVAALLFTTPASAITWNFGEHGFGALPSVQQFDVGGDYFLSARGFGAGNVAAALFGESASRVAMSVVPEQVTAVLRRAAAAGVPARVIGRTGGSRLRIAVAGDIVIDQSVDEAERAWSTAIDRYFAQRVA